MLGDSGCLTICCLCSCFYCCCCRCCCCTRNCWSSVLLLSPLSPLLVECVIITSRHLLRWMFSLVVGSIIYVWSAVRWLDGSIRSGRKMTCSLLAICMVHHQFFRTKPNNTEAVFITERDIRSVARITIHSLTNTNGNNKSMCIANKIQHFMSKLIQCMRVQTTKHAKVWSHIWAYDFKCYELIINLKGIINPIEYKELRNLETNMRSEILYNKIQS